MAARKPNVARKSPRQRRSRVTVETILDAAARILEGEGIEAFNTNRVAALAGVSVGSLYQYFPNKQALARALMERELRAAEASRPAALLPGSGATLAEGIATSVAWHLDIHARRPTYQKRLHEVVREVLEPAEIASVEARHEAAIRAFLGRHAGHIAVDDLEVAALLVSQILLTVPERALLHRPEPMARAALERGMAAMILSYLAGRTPASAAPPTATS